MDFKNRIALFCTFIAITLAVSYYHSESLKQELRSESLEKTGRLLAGLPDIGFENFATKQVENLRDEKGNILFVHFWATWCGPCEKEFPHLINLMQKMKGQPVKFMLVAVNDKEKDIKKFLKRFKSFNIENSIYIDNDNLHKDKFNTVRLPETYPFNDKGNVLNKFAGEQDWESEKFVSLLTEASKN